MSVIEANQGAVAAGAREGAGRPLFEARDISISFGGIRAVDGVTFDVREGEIFAIVGPNGAGKSTIFNLISRIYEPTGGRLVFQGQDITNVPAAHDRGPRHCPHVPEHRAVRACDRARQPADRPPLPLAPQHPQGAAVHARRRRGGAAHRAAVEEVIDFLALANYREQRISGLPYGVRKVVELARALCAEPKLLLLDEPASGLNTEETEEVAFWIEDINEDLGITVIMIEHDMSRCRRCRTRAGPQQRPDAGARQPEQVQSDPAVIEAYLGGDAE